MIQYNIVLINDCEFYERCVHACGTLLSGSNQTRFQVTILTMAHDDNTIKHQSTINGTHMIKHDHKLIDQSTIIKFHQ